MKSVYQEIVLSGALQDVFGLMSIHVRAQHPFHLRLILIQRSKPQLVQFHFEAWSTFLRQPVGAFKKKLQELNDIK
jgi:hypothetical protein